MVNDNQVESFGFFQSVMVTMNLQQQNQGNSGQQCLVLSVQTDI